MKKDFSLHKIDTKEGNEFKDSESFVLDKNNINEDDIKKALDYIETAIMMLKPEEDSEDIFMQADAIESMDYIKDMFE